MCLNSPHPATGNIETPVPCLINITIHCSVPATMKLGTEIPIIATNILKLSLSFPLLRAAKMPIGKPIIKARIIAKIPKIKDFGKLFAII